MIMVLQVCALVAYTVVATWTGLDARRYLNQYYSHWSPLRRHVVASTLGWFWPVLFLLMFISIAIDLRRSR